MKDEENEKTAWGRFRRGKDSPAGIHKTGRSLWQNEDNARSLSVPGGEPVLPHVGGGNRLQKQNLAKAPPGRAPTARGHPPSGETGICEEKGKYELKKMNNTTGTVSGQSLIPIENERINTNKKTKQYKHLNFTIMKKQILFLAFLVLAGLAGITGAYAQQVDTPNLDAAPASCPTPTPLTNCGTGDPLHPIAGANYTYTIDQTGGAGSVVHWFVADDTTPLITGGAVTATIDPGDGNGSYILNTQSAVYNQGLSATTPNTSTSIDVKWKAFDGITNKVVLVAFVTDAAGCTNNIQAWKIEPKYSFIIEIAGLQDGGQVFLASGGTNAFECVSPVQSAIWDGSNVTMDYGDNYIFYLVSAANFVHGWLATYSAAIIAGNAGGGSTLGTIEWAYADQANIDGTSTYWHPMTDPVLAAHYGNAVNDAIGPDGACIVLRVNVDHANEEVATTGEQVEMTVDGVMYNADTDAYDTKYPDMDDAATSGGACQVGSNDKATYDITPRPNITPNTPTDSFVPKN